MKNYNKPEIFVTEFTPNEAVTICKPETNMTWTQQNVSCLVQSGSQEGIFGTTGCEINVYANDNMGIVTIDPNDVNTTFVVPPQNETTYEYNYSDDNVDYKANTYFYWKADIGGTAPSKGGLDTETGVLSGYALIAAIQQLFGLNTQGMHVGLTNPTITSYVNMST